MRQALLLYNPVSGRQRSARLVPQVLAALEAGGFAVAPRPTAGPGDATRLAAAAVAGGDVEVVFALGGDGTLRETAAGLRGSDVALGPLPLGTANVLALSLAIPRSPIAAARAAAAWAPRSVDVGTVGDEPFLMMLSVGLDAAVVAAQDPLWKRHLGRAAFAASGAARWWRYEYPEIEVRSGDWSTAASFVAVCNIPHYGGAFRMAPAADVCDGQLDLVLFRGRDRISTLAFARDLFFARHVDRADVEVRRVTEVEIDGPRALLAQLDGDALGEEPPFRVGIERCALRVLAPAVV